MADREHPQRVNRPNQSSSALQGLALVAGAGALLLINLACVGVNRNWWRPVLGLRFEASTAAGLQPGMPVKISGIPAGRIRHLRIRPDARVMVTLDLGEAYRPLLGPRSRATLAQDTLLGNTYVAISPDPRRPGSRDLMAGSTLPYDSPPDLQNLISSLGSIQAPLQQTLKASAGLAGRRIPASLDELDRTLRSSRQLAGSLERDLGSTTATLSRTADTVNGTAQQVRRTSIEADQLLRQAGGSSEQALPLLLQTLQELRGIATTTHALVRRLDRSLLLDLLSPPAGTPASTHPQAAPPAAAAASPAQERNRRE